MNDPQNPYQPPSPPAPATEKVAFHDVPAQAASPVPSPQLETPAEILAPNRPKGKVARLPKKLRDQLNQMLDDGITYAEIILKLGEPGQGLTEVNISNWRGGGYKQWLKEQQRLDGMRVRQEFAIDLVRQNEGLTTHQAASQIAALNLCDIVDDFNPAVLKRSLDTEPQTYAMLLNAYTRLLQAMPGLGCAEGEYERLRAEEQERRAKLQKEDPGQKEPGLSDKARREMEQKLNLM